MEFSFNDELLHNCEEQQLGLADLSLLGTYGDNNSRTLEFFNELPSTSDEKTRLTILKLPKPSWTHH